MGKGLQGTLAKLCTWVNLLPCSAAWLDRAGRLAGHEGAGNEVPFAERALRMA